MPKGKPRYYLINGEQKRLRDISIETGIPAATLQYRVNIAGMDLLEAIKKGVPVREKTYLYRGESHPISYYANRFDVNKHSLRYWLNKGYDVSDAVDKIRYKNMKPRSIPDGCKFPDCERCTFSDCIAP